MDHKMWLNQIQEKTQIQAVAEANQYTERFGISISGKEARELVACKNESLKKYGRVEFGESILKKLIYVFCDSDYVRQDNFTPVVSRLQDIFFQFKNEAMDLITDDELLTYMREQFDEVCFGDLDYLEGTCLSIFAQALRAGYDGHIAGGGAGLYGEFDEVARWDKELYLQALKELAWE